MRVLLVEDEPALGMAVRDHVAADGHAVDWFQRLDLAGAALSTTQYELVLLDLSLPDGRGLDLLRSLRRSGKDVPVIVLTARDKLTDRIEGLNAGADDYLVKPFDLMELTARLNAVARRYVRAPSPQLEVGALQLDLAARTARIDGCVVSLTAREWAVIELLARRRGATVTKAALEEALYAFGQEVESNAVEAHVSRLRKKLGRNAIRTLRGLGYRLGDGSDGGDDSP